MADGSLLVTPDDVARASRRVAGRLHRTPMLTSRALGEAFGGTALLKAELFQRTGSFKPRGLLARLAGLDADARAKGVVTVSAGNAAAALAYGAALEGVDSLVCMWQCASPHKVAATQAYGATVDQDAASPEEAFARVQEIAEETGRTFVHPFDDHDVIAGHGSLGYELVEDAPDVDVVVVPVGGGGLVSGVTVAVKDARPEARVVAVEPEGSAALHAALLAGRPVKVVPTSIADGLNAPFAGRRCVAVTREHDVETVLVTEDEIRAGFRFLYGRAKLAVEPAAAAAAGALLAGRIGGLEGRTVVSVVSGGNVSARMASDILASHEA